MNSPIVVATTFREFRNTENDAIQWMFLWSLRRAGVPVKLVVTTFGEATVEENVRTVFPNASIRTVPPSQGKKYSHTDVLESGILEMERGEGHALLWTTCDVLLSRPFLQRLQQVESGLSIHTSHPHWEMQSDGQIRKYPDASGFDCMAFSRDLVLNPRFRDHVGRYRFNEWGIFEHFLVAASKSVGAIGQNHIAAGRVIKLENDRVVTRESTSWMTESWRENAATLEKFLADQGVSRGYLSLFGCHRFFRSSFVNWFDPRSWLELAMEIGRIIQRPKSR